MGAYNRLGFPGPRGPWRRRIVLRSVARRFDIWSNRQSAETQWLSQLLRGIDAQSMAACAGPAFEGGLLGGS